MFKICDSLYFTECFIVFSLLSVKWVVNQTDFDQNGCVAGNWVYDLNIF